MWRTYSRSLIVKAKRRSKMSDQRDFFCIRVGFLIWWKEEVYSPSSNLFIWYGWPHDLYYAAAVYTVTIKRCDQWPHNMCLARLFCLPTLDPPENIYTQIKRGQCPPTSPCARYIFVNPPSKSLVQLGLPPPTATQGIRTESSSLLRPIEKEWNSPLPHTRLSFIDIFMMNR